MKWGKNIIAKEPVYLSQTFSKLWVVTMAWKAHSGSGAVSIGEWEYSLLFSMLIVYFLKTRFKNTHTYQSFKLNIIQSLLEFSFSIGKAY